MPRIRCHYVNCVFLDDEFCGAPSVVVDPEEGCLTYKQASALQPESWDDDDSTPEEGWEDMGFEEEEDDLWLEEGDD